MTTMLISNDSEHQSALAELSLLMDASEGTEAGERLKSLADAIEAYEEKRYPFDKPTAGEAIRFRMGVAGLKESDLAELIGPIETVREILGDRKKLTPAMAKRVHRSLLIPLDVLLPD